MLVDITSGELSASRNHIMTSPPCLARQTCQAPRQNPPICQLTYCASFMHREIWQYEPDPIIADAPQNIEQIRRRSSTVTLGSKPHFSSKRLLLRTLDPDLRGVQHQGSVLGNVFQKMRACFIIIHHVYSQVECFTMCSNCFIMRCCYLSPGISATDNQPARMR